MHSIRRNLSDCDDLPPAGRKQTEDELTQGMSQVSEEALSSMLMYANIAVSSPIEALSSRCVTVGVDRISFTVKGSHCAADRSCRMTHPEQGVPFAPLCSFAVTARDDAVWRRRIRLVLGLARQPMSTTLSFLCDASFEDLPGLRRDTLLHKIAFCHCEEIRILSDLYPCGDSLVSPSSQKWKYFEFAQFSPSSWVQ